MPLTGLQSIWLCVTKMNKNISAVIVASVTYSDVIINMHRNNGGGVLDKLPSYTNTVCCTPTVCWCKYCMQNWQELAKKQQQKLEATFGSLGASVQPANTIEKHKVGGN